MVKKCISIGMIVIYLLTTTSNIMAVTDRDILSDPVANTYKAEAAAEAITNNLQFTDMPMDHWAKEPVTRLGALSVVKGYNEGNRLTFRPDASVSNEETLAFLMRLIGQEEAAVLAAQNIVNNPEDPAMEIWSRGYLQIASGLGLITANDLADGLALDQSALDPEFNWIRRDVATREQVALWLVQALNANVPDTLAPVYAHQEIFTLNDWEDIGPEFLSYVEAVMAAGIMIGDGSSFRPKSAVTRAEMAQIMVNLEEILYETMGLTLKGGIVGSVVQSSVIGTLKSERRHTYLIRNDEGFVDQVAYIQTENSHNTVTAEDVPVLTSDSVTGLNSLKEGDYIQYLVDDLDGTMKYIRSTGYGEPVEVIGKLQPMVGFDEGKITLNNDTDISFTYQMIDGIYDVFDSTIEIGDSLYPLSSAPVGNTVTLTIQNDLVTHIAYEGAVPLSMEVSGIVKEISVKFRFITIEAWNGGEITKYFGQDVRVEKQNYYDDEDEIGYIDEVYPTYAYDERDADISAIDPGDIVHMKMDPANLQYVTDISAKTNYSVKFGTIMNIRDYGAQGLNIRIGYSDNALGALEVSGDTPVFINGVNQGITGLKEGQLVKVLMNQAVLGPGRTMETVVQVDVDPYGNQAVNMYKGEPRNYDEVKETFSLVNSYTLSDVGWMDYTQMQSFELSDDGVEVYFEGDRISLSYMEKYLIQPDMMAFAVTENHFGEEKLAKLILEDGWDEVLAPTNVTYSDGNDTIRLVSSVDDIYLNDGTIVVKDGHIVSPGSILSPDYAQVVLGDDNYAVMVNITPEPNNDALSILRGRIDSIDPLEGFKVESNAMLKEMAWIYSPVEREFTLSYDTVIIDADGRIPVSDFIDYSEVSKVDEVYTIIVDGTEATHLYHNPYATEGVSGIIYDTDDSTIYLRDAYVYDGETMQWEILSLRNNYAEIALETATVVIKNNQVVEVDDLKFGDQIRVLVTDDLSEEMTLKDNRRISGYIIFAE